MNSKILVLSTGPHNFAGAGVAHARTLELFARMGAEVYFFCTTRPFREDSMRAAGVTCIHCEYHSDAYGTSDVIANALMAEAMLQVATRWLADHPGGRIVLLGTYLFPFCPTIELAARELRQISSKTKSIVIPAGSDIWQTGRQVPLMTRFLLESNNVSHVCTYSARFSREISDWIGINRPISVIPPAINTLHFSPIDIEGRLRSRSAIGISDSEFVLCHCSNHRPVKALHHVLEVASALPSRLARPVHLVMVGPYTNHLSRALTDSGFPAAVDGEPYQVRRGHLQVTCAGLQRDTKYYHSLADLAINTSLHDSFNISLAEAMACGVPVVTTDVAGIAAVVQHYECGVLIPFSENSVYASVVSKGLESKLNLAEGFEHLVSLCSNDYQRFEYGRRARRAIIETCSDNKIEKDWLNLLEAESTESGSTSTTERYSPSRDLG